MHRKIIYLINPVSGTKGKLALQKQLSEKTKERNIAFEILYTNAAGDYQELKNRIVKEKITDIVVCGGDGSVSAVAAAVMGVDVRIGIVPMGSGNGLARAAKIPVATG